jgi:flagellar hook protein FlgE
MDVLGNNIANVNTIGFKKGRVNFHDLISQSIGGAARPIDELGGVNPKQVGLGMNISSIDTIHTQGSLQTTGVMTDVALQGDGFFIMRTGNKNLYTRAGAFGLDENGHMVNPANGMRVQGWAAETVEGRTFINTSDSVGDILVPVGSKDPAAATLEVFLACNLDKRTPEIPEGAGPLSVLEGTWSTSFDIFDSFGNIHTLRVDFSRRAGEPNRWDASVTIDPELETTNTLVDLGPGGNNNANTFIVEFSNLGTLQAVEDAAGDRLTEGALQVQVGFDVADAAPGADGAVLRQTFNLNLGQAGNVVNTVTQFAEKSSTKAFKQDGYAMGYLETFKIDQSGTITGVYSNGNNRVLAQIALASFVNPSGLEKAGDSTYAVTNNSGEPNIAPSGVAGKGKLVAGTLEMSNVDLAEQFTDMIVTQRGFQASSKTIQTSDQMLQELLTLKR